MRVCEVLPRLSPKGRTFANLANLPTLRVSLYIFVLKDLQMIYMPPGYLGCSQARKAVTRLVSPIFSFPGYIGYQI